MIIAAITALIGIIGYCNYELATITVEGISKMGLFERCSKSPDKRHHYVGVNLGGHWVLHCKYCGRIK